MKRIMMTKYGFERWPERDFTDDSSRYVCYRAGKAVRVSKLISDGQAYLSISSDCGRGTLPYETYSKLPHYHDAEWRWNGIPAAGLTDKDLQDFYNACVEYEKEYLAAEAALVYPTLEEIKAQAQKIYAARYIEINKISQLLASYGCEAALKLSEWEWQNIKDYVTNLCQEYGCYNPDTFPQTIVGTARSFDFVKPTNSALEPSYWFERLVEYFNKVKA